MNAMVQAAESPSDPNLKRTWRIAGIVVSLAVIGVLLTFYSTAEAMVSIWHRSETFAHGYLILPITLWLVWRKRVELSALHPVPNGWGLVLLGVVGAGWMIANVAGVGVVQQLALVAMVIVVVWTVVGTRVAVAMAFPLFFLFFSVPMGENLVPPLRVFTADFTVKLVELTGIPIYREGTFFELPSGNWSVVDACSGVRYLIASITLGTLYAYLTYSSLTRRLVFILASFAVPIIANGLRAFMIVMIGHFSDMQYAVGVDHLIYGWVFFGVVIGLMFYVGSFWRQDEAVTSPVESTGVQTFTQPTRFWIVGAASLLVAGLWPGLVQLRPNIVDGAVSTNLVAPVIDGWEKTDVRVTDWKPNYSGMDATVNATYVKGDRKFGLTVYYFSRQTKGSELISTRNVLVTEEDKVWQQKIHQSVSYELGGSSASVDESILRSSEQSLFVVSWNWIAGTHTNDPYFGKMLEAKTRLLEGVTQSAVILYTPFDGPKEAEVAPMQAFVKDALPGIEAALFAATNGH